MTESLKQHGFSYSSSCRCGGTLTLKYLNNKTSLMVKHRPEKKTFAVFTYKGNSRLSSWLNENEFNENIKKFIK